MPSIARPVSGSVTTRSVVAMPARGAGASASTSAAARPTCIMALRTVPAVRDTRDFRCRRAGVIVLLDGPDSHACGARPVHARSSPQLQRRGMQAPESATECPDYDASLAANVGFGTLGHGGVQGVKRNDSILRG